MEKTMSFFIEAEVNEVKEVEIKGIDKYAYPKGHKLEGTPIPWLLKPVQTEDVRIIREKHTHKKKVKKKGSSNKTKVIETLDQERYNDDLLVNTIVYPNFKDKAWLEKESLVDPIELMRKVLSLPGDYAEINQQVLSVNGFDIDDDDLVDEAKN